MDQPEKPNSTEIVVSSRDKLTDKEKTTLAKWEKQKDKSPLATDISMALYELFLNGHSCDEIVRVAKLNGSDFPLGMVLDARIRHNWDDRRETHLAHLFKEVGLTVKQRQMEAVTFVTDLLSAAHKMHGDKIRKFMHSGDKNDLGDFAIGTMGSYTKTIELLLKLTGQDKATVSGGTQVNVIAGNAEVKTEEKKKIGPLDAAKLLELIDNSGKS